VLITAASVGAACGDTRAPEVDTAAVDLCEQVDPSAPAAFLTAIGAGAVEQEQGRSDERAAVCGWFLGAEGDRRPEGVVVRVESVLADGNPACVPPSGAEVDDLGFEGAETSWITLGQDRVDAAATTARWCLYGRGPLDAIGEPDAAAAATRSLLSEVVDAMDRS
jgi:hypothetical protein